MNIVFFGSSSDSVVVLAALHKKFPVCAVVTQKAKPSGRKKILTPTPVDSWAKKNTIPVLTFAQDKTVPWKFENDDDVINTVDTWKQDLIVTACYGQKIPYQLIEKTPHKAVNVHPSLLPRWRGGDPVPWTILASDAQTGVTIVTVTENFDEGKILAQKKIAVDKHDTSDALRSRLFAIGAELLTKTLPSYISGKNKGNEQRWKNTPVARRLTRADGFIPWDEFMEKIQDHPTDLDVRLRALTPWPGVWTIVPFGKRLKLIALTPSPVVQLEGKKSVDWKIFKKAYL